MAGPGHHPGIRVWSRYYGMIQIMNSHSDSESRAESFSDNRDSDFKLLRLGIITTESDSDDDTAKY